MAGRWLAGQFSDERWGDLRVYEWEEPAHGARGGGASWGRNGRHISFTTKEEIDSLCMDAPRNAAIKVWYHVVISGSNDYDPRMIG